MNKWVLWLVAVSGLLASSVLTVSSAQAREVSGVALESSLTTDDVVLVLNGAGVRSKFFMDLYVGSLYLPKPQSTIESVLNQPYATVRLNITSSMITSDKMKDAIDEGFELATSGNLTPIENEIQTFMSMFSEAISKGDQFTFETTQSGDVTSFKNGVEQGKIQSTAFREALLKIWLGDKPAQKSLRKAMLAQ